jgi:hypothetical protein
MSMPTTSILTCLTACIGVLSACVWPWVASGEPVASPRHFLEPTGRTVHLVPFIPGDPESYAKYLQVIPVGGSIQRHAGDSCR